MTVTVANVHVNVISAGYQPLGATSLKRAIALVNRGDAVIEEADDGRELRYERGSFPWPLVIRLLRFFKVPVTYGPSYWSKSGVMRRDGNKCGYCGERASTVDHIIPRSRGGEDTWENTVACCIDCNIMIKRDRTPEEAGLTLLITPFTPQRVYYHGGSKNRSRRHG